MNHLRAIAASAFLLTSVSAFANETTVQQFPPKPVVGKDTAAGTDATSHKIAQATKGGAGSQVRSRSDANGERQSQDR